MDRYQRLYSIGNNLYQEGSPIIIEAGVLLLDTKSGRTIAQLKLRNITNDLIKAVQVDLASFDIGGLELESVNNFQYLDLNVQLGETFGTKTPIYLPAENVRSYVVKTVVVFFENGDRWTSDSSWMELSNPIKKKGTTDFLIQYKLELGSKAEYIFNETNKVWQCVCGSYVDESVEKCYCCHMKKEDIKGISDEVITAHLNERLTREEEERFRMEEEEKLQREQKLQEIQKVKKNCIFGGIIIAIVLILFGAYTILEPVVNKKRAENAVENNEYEKAISIYKNLNDKGDYDDEIEECNRSIYYENALAEIENSQYDEAIGWLKKLPQDYQDTLELLKKSVLNYAEELYSGGKYEECIEILSANDITSSDSYRKASYQLGLQMMNEENWEQAIDYFEICGEYEEATHNIQICQNGITYDEALLKMKLGKLTEAIEIFNNLPADFKDTSRYLDLCKQYKVYEREWICKTYRIKHYYNNKTSNLDYSADSQNMKSTAKLCEDGTMKIYFDDCVAEINGNIATWYKWGDVPNTFNMSTGSRVMQFYHSDGSESDTYIYTYKVN